METGAKRNKSGKIHRATQTGRVFHLRAVDCATYLAQQLPFVPTFDQASMVAGQSVSITWHGDSEQPAPIYYPAATVTLIPQTINGIVLSAAQEGSFQEYVVALAGYDLFPHLSNETFQTSPLNDPGTVVVYADSTAVNDSIQPISVGNLARFTGLVFNDAGTLRMAAQRST